MGLVMRATRAARASWAAALCGALLAGAADLAPALADDAPLDIVVVKRPGISAYQEVTEEFAENCRVRARVINLVGPAPELHKSDVVLAVGQRALEAVEHSGARVVSALAFRVPYGVIAADVQPPPELSLRALKVARPSVRRVGVVYGPSSDVLVAQMREPAAALGLVLVKARALDGPAAVRELNRISGQIDALWLAPDLDVMVPQLFQYALGLEIRRAIPIVGVSRHQVRSGALLAVDADPRAIGRQAAALVNELLAGVPAEELMAATQTGSLELVVNADVARRLHADVAALKALGARFD